MPSNCGGTFRFSDESGPPPAAGARSVTRRRSKPPYVDAEKRGSSFGIDSIVWSGRPAENSFRKAFVKG